MDILNKYWTCWKIPSILNGYMVHLILLVEFDVIFLMPAYLSNVSHANVQEYFIFSNSVCSGVDRGIMSSNKEIPIRVVLMGPRTE